jgi:hypothetical protein
VFALSAAPPPLPLPPFLRSKQKEEKDSAQLSLCGLDIPVGCSDPINSVISDSSADPNMHHFVRSDPNV